MHQGESFLLVLYHMCVFTFLLGAYVVASGYRLPRLNKIPDPHTTQVWDTQRSLSVQTQAAQTANMPES